MNDPATKKALVAGWILLAVFLPLGLTLGPSGANWGRSWGAFDPPLFKSAVPCSVVRAAWFA